MADHFKKRKEVFLKRSIRSACKFEVDKAHVREELVSSLNDILKMSPDGSI